ncbi:MAG: hypothetical protein IIZ51_04260 [Lachnospiraceae bacterium]|nr:hypothetical protein [Lachnospiraceae bacterium]
MNRALTFEQKRANFEKYGYADPDYCVRVLRDMAGILPEILLEPDEDLGTCVCAELLDRCFDADYAAVPRTFANCAANCARLIDEERYEDFDDLLYCMDRSMHGAFESVSLSGMPIPESLLRRSAKARAEITVSRFLLLTLEGLRDAELALAKESERVDIEQTWRRLLEPDMKICRPMGEEGPLRVFDAMTARYRKMKSCLDRQANRIGSSVLMFPFTLESFRTVPQAADPLPGDDGWITDDPPWDIPF